jgi:alpha-glucosidase/alpha-D-xyloside xylohydrolase
MPIYVRAGAIIPVDPVRQYTGEPVTEPTTLRVYRGADGRFTLYADDGTSQDYLTGGGRGSWTRLTWNDRIRRLTMEPGAPAEATNVPGQRLFNVQLLPDGATKRVTYRGTRIQVTF